MNTPILAHPVHHLLQATITRQVAPNARITDIGVLPINPGVSKVHVQRYVVQVEGPASQPTTVQLVTKPAPLVERRVLAHLQRQVQAIVPFSHTLDVHTDATTLVCMQDVGDTLIEDAATFTEQTAHGLAAIHAANRGRAAALAWLPRTDHAYFTDFIVGHCWRPAWDRALADPAFVDSFGAYLPVVARAVQDLPHTMLALYHEGDVQTLIHTDIYYGHVLEHADRPWIIDWGQAHYGALYLDLPSHFRTLDQALCYRDSLADHGVAIPRDHFVARYRRAAQFVAIRYLWWWIEEWRRDHAPWQQEGLIEMFAWLEA